MATKIEFPDIDKDEIYAPLSQLCFDVWLEERPNLTPFQLNKTIKHILFNKHHFQTTRNKYSELKYLLPNAVINNKIGDDIAIGLIYLYIAQARNIPMRATNLNGIFTLFYSSKENDITINDVDFFVSPYLHGFSFSIKQFNTFIKKEKNSTLENIHVLSDKDLVLLFLKRLEYTYNVNENERKCNQTNQLINIISN